MDPSETELQGFNDLNSIYDWAGIAQDLRTTLAAALGNPAMIRDLVFIPRGEWDAVVSGLSGGPGPPDADGNPGPPRALTAIDRSRMEMLRRVCFLRAGATPDTPGHARAPVAAAVAPGAAQPAAIGSSAGRKLKLSAVVDQALDAEIQPMDHQEVTALFDKYRQMYGDVPATDAEPTADQLAGIRQLVQANATPYIDFAIFGPHGMRLLRKLTFSANVLNSQGEWTRREFPGPPNYEAWHKIFRCMRTAFLLLEVATAERLDAYGEHIRSLNNRFGHECWDIVYHADIHMRSEEFERIRRRLTLTPAHGFTPGSPWNAVFAQAIKEDAFWTREVITDATLRLARGRSVATAPAEPGATSAGDGTSRKRKVKANSTEDRSKKGPDGNFTINRRGVEICAAWNAGRCGKPTPQSKCTQTPPRSHQCSKCLGPHQAKACPK